MPKTEKRTTEIYVRVGMVGGGPTGTAVTFKRKTIAGQVGKRKLAQGGGS